MKKLLFAITLAAVLVLFLLAGTALAAEIPDPDFYFNAGAAKQTNGDNVTYDYVMTDDPRMAVEAYVTLLTDTYGFELTDSYLEPEVAAWWLEGAASEKVWVTYDQGGAGYSVILDVDTGILCKAAEAWDWSKQAIAGAESSDITVLPDFLKHDNSGKYYYRGTGFSFRADSTSSDCVSVAEDYVDLLLQRGYIFVDSEEEHSKNWDMYKWYLHSGLSGLDQIESDIDAHVMVRINAYHNKGYCAVSVNPVPGLTMEGYGQTPDDEATQYDSNGTFNENNSTTKRYKNCSKIGCDDGEIECSRCNGDGGKYISNNSTPNYSGSGSRTGLTWEKCSKCNGAKKVDCPACINGKVEY